MAVFDAKVERTGPRTWWIQWSYMATLHYHNPDSPAVPEPGTPHKRTVRKRTTKSKAKAFAKRHGIPFEPDEVTCTCVGISHREDCPFHVIPF